MQKQFIQELTQDWNFGVYLHLLEVAQKSFSVRPLRGPGFLISVQERAFSSTVCTLAAFQVESMLQNIAHKQGMEDSKDELLKIISNQKLRQAVRELFVLRNVIAHSHLYETSINLKNDGDTKSSYNKKVRGRSDSEVVRNKTKLLKFNVVPARVDFTDSVCSIMLSFVSQRN